MSAAVISTIEVLQAGNYSWSSDRCWVLTVCTYCSQ